MKIDSKSIIRIHGDDKTFLYFFRFIDMFNNILLLLI